MADSFFGFDTSHAGALDDAIDCPLDEDEIGEEDEYDALNDETFGTEASAGDWEQDHEKLAQITESTRPQGQINKNGLDVDIEGSLAHLVLDEKDGIVPRPGVWDSPSLPIISQPPPPVLITVKPTFCTLEDIERGLRPPPGLVKPTNAVPNVQLPRTQGGQYILDYPGLNDHLRTNILNLTPPRFPPGLGIAGPHPVVLPPNVRLPLPPNQAANLMRYPLLPHLMLSHGNQRGPMHGNFIGNFPPPPPRPNLPPEFLRQNPHLIPGFNNNHHANHHQHLHQQQQQQQQHATNQRNQNRPFHHNNEQPPNHNQPFFKNNQHWHQNRVNQRYHHHHGHGMNGFNENGEYDEYAGLMSTREKQWLTNIQLLQHNTHQPYFDDYYFTVYCDRKQKKGENHDHGKDKKNKNGYRDNRDKDGNQHILTKVVYTPTQFENSLGKLQCGSVTAPRKIIDMDVVPNSDPQGNAPTHVKDMKKARQRLLEIEKMYTIQLKLEDVNNPLALIAEQQALQQQQQQQQQSETEPEPKPPKKTAPELIQMMLGSLMQLMKEDKLAGILSVRKGKMLLLRFLPFLSVTEYAIPLAELWIGLIKGLAVIGRRDSHVLVRFFPEFHNWLETCADFNILLRLARGFLETANFPSRLNNSLAFAVSNKFGVSVIASLLEQAEILYPKDDTMAKEWSTFIITLADTIGSTPPIAAPCQPIAANTLNEHLHRVHGLTIERYAPLETLLTDANPSR